MTVFIKLVVMEKTGQLRGQLRSMVTAFTSTTFSFKIHKRNTASYYK